MRESHGFETSLNWIRGFVGNLERILKITSIGKFGASIDITQALLHMLIISKIIAYIYAFLCP